MQENWVFTITMPAKDFSSIQDMFVLMQVHLKNNFLSVLAFPRLGLCSQGLNATALELPWLVVVFDSIKSVFYTYSDNRIDRCQWHACILFYCSCIETKMNQLCIVSAATKQSSDYISKRIYPQRQFQCLKTKKERSWNVFQYYILENSSVDRTLSATYTALNVSALCGCGPRSPPPQAPPAPHPSPPSLPPPSLPFPEGDVAFLPSAGRLTGPVLSLWMAPSMACPAVIEHYEVFHASVH